MARIAFPGAVTQRLASRSYGFTVIFQPSAGEIRSARSHGQSNSQRRSRNSAGRGYQVTVPMLPGLFTYGRTLREAREMVADATRVHIECLRKDGEPIPVEATTRTEKLPDAISAWMSPRLPVLNPREVLRALLRAGFEIQHQTGSHAPLRNLLEETR
jgi:predicted RNase H-like HicB family nuclease